MKIFRISLLVILHKAHSLLPHTLQCLSGSPTPHYVSFINSWKHFKEKYRKFVGDSIFMGLI
jgi:hypothetical protein